MPSWLALCCRFWLDTWVDMYEVKGLCLATGSLQAGTIAVVGGAADGGAQQHRTHLGRRGVHVGRASLGCIYPPAVRTLASTMGSKLMELCFRIWPRAMAVAERLWSTEATTDKAAAAQRLGERAYYRALRHSVLKGWQGWYGAR